MKWIELTITGDGKQLFNADQLELIRPATALEKEEARERLNDTLNTLVWSIGSDDGEYYEVQETYEKVKAMLMGKEERHAHWIDMCRGKVRRCSLCGVGQDATFHDIDEGWRYCPNCGARMDEEVSDEVD